MKESKVKLTWNHKYDVLSRSEVLSPVAIESDEDEHEALGVEGSPAEEECEDNCNYNASYEDGHTNDCIHVTKHSDYCPLSLG